MAEAILLATVAFRCGKRLEWDGASMRAPNAPESARFINPPARKGWTLPWRPRIGMYK